MLGKGKMPETIETDNMQAKNGRNEKGRFVKGSVHNPRGNTHSKDMAGLIVALEDKSKREGYKNFDYLVADRAMKYKEVLIAVMKKVYPDQSVPIVNIYTQIWNNLEKKGRDVDANGRVHIKQQDEVSK